MGTWKGFSHFTFKVCLHPSHEIYPDKGKCENENFVDSKVATIPYSRKVWRIDSFRAFGERKFGELIDQPIGYQL